MPQSISIIALTGIGELWIPVAQSTQRVSTAFIQAPGLSATPAASAGHHRRVASAQIRPWEAREASEQTRLWEGRVASAALHSPAAQPEPQGVNPVDQQPNPTGPGHLVRLCPELPVGVRPVRQRQQHLLLPLLRPLPVPRRRMRCGGNRSMHASFLCPPLLLCVVKARLAAEPEGDLKLSPEMGSFSGSSVIMEW